MNPTIKPIEIKENKDTITAWVGGVRIAYILQHSQGFELKCDFNPAIDEKGYYVKLEDAKDMIKFHWDNFIYKISQPQVSAEVVDDDVAL